MGQAFRRMGGRLMTTQPPPQPPSSSKDLRITLDRVFWRLPEVEAEISRPSSVATALTPKWMMNPDNLLEERDTGYNAMLGQMVGRIRSNPRGMPEMGEATVVEKYKRPLPKLQNTTPDSGRYEERPVAPGTLNVAQVKQIILLYQGKSEDKPDLWTPKRLPRSSASMLHMSRG